MKKYADMVKDLRAKNFNNERIKELVLEKAKKEINHFNFGFKWFKVKEDAGAEQGKVIEIEGYASTKDEDRYGDIVNPGAFEKTIEQFMANPVMLLQHDHNKRIGDFTELNIDDKGLYVKGEVKYTAGDTELFEKIENKSLRGFSIWFRVLEAEFQEKLDEKGNIVDFLFIIKELDLIEISVVNVPANPFTLMKSIENLTTKSFEEVAKDIETDENENSNENQEENNNDNSEEKEIKTEITNDKVEDEEAENDGDEEVIESPEEEAEDTPEEKNLDEDDEKDIVKDEDESPENPNEKEDVEQSGEDSKAFTTKMIEKIVDAKMGGNKNEVKALVEKGVKALEKDFNEKLKAVKGDLETEIDALVETIKEVKKTESELVNQIKNTIKGKWFINLQTTDERKEKDNRLSRILKSVQGNNKF